MGCFRLGKAVGCFRFDEQEVHMHSTKNVNETHSSQFLMETGLDLGDKEEERNGVPLIPPNPLPRKKKEGGGCLQHEAGNDSSEVKGKKIVWDERGLRDCKCATWWGGHTGPTCALRLL